jgi:hypothetical protein
MLCVLAKGGVTLFPYDPDTCCTGIFVSLTVGSLSVGTWVLDQKTLLSNMQGSYGNMTMTGGSYVHPPSNHGQTEGSVK